VFRLCEYHVPCHPDGSYLNKNERIIYTSYHQYSPTLSLGLQATEEGTCDASESEATCTQDHRASTSSSIIPALYLDLSTSISACSSRKCDTVATNAVQDPQQTPLADVASIWVLSSSTTVDKDVARKDDPLAPLSTKSQTRAAEDRRASNSASASRRAANSALSYSVASFGRSASQTRLGSGPSSRSQICVAGHSSCECHP
jgi:hypothetical protein